MRETAAEVRIRETTASPTAPPPFSVTAAELQPVVPKNGTLTPFRPKPTKFVGKEISGEVPGTAPH